MMSRAMCNDVCRIVHYEIRGGFHVTTHASVGQGHDVRVRDDSHILFSLAFYLKPLF
jgi:hypothetical protein